MSGKPLLLLTKLTVSFAVPSASNTLLVLTKETILCFIVKSICWTLVVVTYQMVEGVESLAAVLVNTSIETLVLCWSSAHPDTTLEKIGECISNNNLLRKLNLTIIQRLQESHEFLQLVEAGGKKLMQYLKNTNIQQIDFTIKHNIVSFVSTNRVFDALGTAKDTVNLVRRSNGLPDIKLRQLSIQQ